MIISGIVNDLRISRFTENGAYLVDEENEEVLMPNRYLTDGMLVDDQVSVFVYHDSENRQVAITDFPLAMVGEVAYLRVVDNNSVGAFVDWGLPKDLLVPKKNQLTDLFVGQKYMCAVYRDMTTGRVVATTRLSRYIYNDDLELELGSKVDFIVAVESEIGFRVVIENKHWGVIYHDQIFTPVAVGDRLSGYVRCITEDNRVDISLRPDGFALIEDSLGGLRSLLEKNGGFLEIGDKSEAGKIHSITGMSKKSFKKAVGMLLKTGAIEITEQTVKLVNKDK